MDMLKINIINNIKKKKRINIINMGFTMFMDLPLGPLIDGGPKLAWDLMGLRLNGPLGQAF